MANLASDKFPEVGSIAQALKYQIRSGTYWDELSPAAKESLDQIATSIARTVSGDGAHWDGIVGYAQAARPTIAEPAPTRGLEREIHKLVREIPHRDNDHA
jgi:hypothetical protein